MLCSPLRLSPLAVALWLASSPSQAVELEPQVITANPLGNRQLAAPSTVLEGDGKAGRAIAVDANPSRKVRTP